MARKQLGMVDDALLDEVDCRALALGQTRRVFVERALESYIKQVDNELAGAGSGRDAVVPAAAVRPASSIAQPTGGVSPHLRLGNDSTSAQVKRTARPAHPKRGKK
jgi:hypothetical protein